MRSAEMIAAPAILAGPAILAAAAQVLVLLPREASLLLFAWILASFPIGVMLGHCVLRDNQHPL